jgi:hypothetical protein
MFCPKCRGEYVPGIAFCKKCNVALVNELPELPSTPKLGPPEFAEMVPVAELTSQFDVAMIRGAMEAAGIDFNIRNEDLQSLIGAGFIGGTNTAVGPVYIDVPKPDVKAAEEIVQEYFDRQKDGSEPVADGG